MYTVSSVRTICTTTALQTAHATRATSPLKIRWSSLFHLHAASQPFCSQSLVSMTASSSLQDSVSRGWGLHPSTQLPAHQLDAHTQLHLKLQRLWPWHVNHINRHTVRDISSHSTNLLWYPAYLHFSDVHVSCWTMKCGNDLQIIPVLEESMTVEQFLRGEASRMEKRLAVSLHTDQFLSL